MADSANTFQPGDVVQLKSGGALLTVMQHDEDGVNVYYSDVNGLPQARQQALPASVLQKVTPPSTRTPPTAAETVR